MFIMHIKCQIYDYKYQLIYSQAENAASKLGTSSKTVGSSMAQLLTAAAQGNEDYVGIAARDTVNALKILVGSVRGVAATTDDQQVRKSSVTQ